MRSDLASHFCRARYSRTIRPRCFAAILQPRSAAPARPTSPPTNQPCAPIHNDVPWSVALGFCSAAFCRGAWVRVSSFDRAIYPGRRRAHPSALRLGPHGLPALQTQRQVPPPAPQVPRSPLSRTRHIAICRAELKLPRQQHRPRRARRPPSCLKCPDAPQMDGRTILAARAKRPRSVLVESKPPRE